MILHLIPIITSVITVLLVATAAWSDLKSRRIPNKLTIPAMILGLMLSASGSGWSGFLEAMGGIGLGFCIWLFGLLCGGVLGAGDAKLLMAVGALCGMHFLLLSFVVGVLFGGVMACLITLRHGCLCSTLNSCWIWLVHQFGYRSAVSLSSSTSLQIPYAVPIAMGVIFCMLSPCISGLTGMSPMQIAGLP